jgi:hypothetical protein
MGTAGPGGRFRRLGGMRVPEGLGKALCGRAVGLLPILVPGIACGSQDSRGGTCAVPVTPGRQLRVGACPTDRPAHGASPLTPLRDGADGALRYRPTQTSCSRGECSPRLSVLGMATVMLLPDGASRRCRERRCKQLLVPRPIAAAPIE